MGEKRHRVIGGRVVWPGKHVVLKNDPSFHVMQRMEGFIYEVDSCSQNIPILNCFQATALGFFQLVQMFYKAHHHRIWWTMSTLQRIRRFTGLQ